MIAAHKRKFLRALVYLGVLLLVLSILAALLSKSIPSLPTFPKIDPEISSIPLQLFYSLARTSIALMIALIFGVLVGTWAAVNQRAAFFIIPIIDVFQSIPLIAYIPIAILFFVGTMGSNFGAEAVTVFLILTSMIWNIAYGVYEGVSTIPHEAKESMTAFGVKGWHRFWRLYLPSCTPRLIYNCILSWANGWYFLILCEIIKIPPENKRVVMPGIGSFLKANFDAGHLDLFFIGLGIFLTLIIAFELFLWSPLARWSEKFRYELVTGGAQFGTTRISEGIRKPKRWKRYVRKTSRWLEKHFLNPVLKLGRPLARFKPPPHRRVQFVHGLHKLVLLCIILPLAALFIYFLSGAYKTLMAPWPEEAFDIPYAIAASFLRLVIALALSIVICFPLAVWAGENKKVERILTPLAEIGASVPAPAFFPAISVFAFAIGGMPVASTLLLMTGMIWYLLFNLIAGIRSVPSHLRLASQALGLRGWQKWRRLLLPAAFPSLVTGSITAFGGGWNTLVVAEHLQIGGQTYAANGIGNMMVQALDANNNTLTLLTVLALVITVSFMNRFFWKPVYELATDRYKIA